MSSSTPEPIARQSVSVVIAAYNEERVIRGVVDAVVAQGYRVIVVDDGSPDSTSQALVGSGAIRLRHIVNLGQGAALQTGISYAVAHGAQYVVTFDADGQHDEHQIAPMVESLRKQGLDVLLGSRFLSATGSENMPLAKRILLRAATWMTTRLTGLRLTDTHNGFRCLSRVAAQKINLTQNRMAHASQILSQIAEHQLKYAEHPVTIRYTEYSLQKGQPLSNSFNILWESMSEVLKR